MTELIHDRNFKDYLEYMKSFDSKLRTEQIEPIVYQMTKNISGHRLGSWINNLKTSYQNHKPILEEITYLADKIESLKESLIHSRVEKTFSQLKKGKYIHKEDQMYLREINTTNNGQIIIHWSVKKAQQIINNQKIKRAHFPIENMNIAANELETSYLPESLKNRKPAIIISYEPFADSDLEHFLLDGNHRAYANYLLKGAKMFPAVFLNSEQTIEAMEHNFHRYFYLLHVLERKLWDAHVNNQSIDDVLIPGSRYYQLKDHVKSQ